VQRGPWGAIAVSADGKMVAASSAIRVVVLAAADGRELFAIDRDEDDGPVRAVAFSPDGRLLLAGYHGPTGGVKEWEVVTRSRVRTFSTGRGGVTRLGMFPDGTRVASAGTDETITVWDLTYRAGKPAPTAAELKAAWAALDSRDAGIGVPAIRMLAAGGERGVAAVRAGLAELVGERRQIAEWVRDLDADDFTTREAATKALEGAAHRALAALAEARKSGSPEVRRRAASILDRLAVKNVRPPGHGLAGDGVRLFRAVQALELVGGDEAVAALTEIAAHGGLVRDEANAALKRMAR
jgi:hypothetical protein